MKQFDIRVLIAMFSLITHLGTPAWAGDGDDDRDRGRARRFVGHYQGQLDLSVIGNPRLEDIQIVLHKDGTAEFLSDEDGMEAESTSLGVWKRVGKNRVKIGAVGFRVGERICAAISPPDGRIDDRCTFKVGFDVKVNRHGEMTGFLRPTIIEVNEDSMEVFELEIPANVPLVGVRKTTIDDFNFPD